MEIQKIYSDPWEDDDRRYYSVLLTEDELRLYSELQKEFGWTWNPVKALRRRKIAKIRTALDAQRTANAAIHENNLKAMRNHQLENLKDYQTLGDEFSSWGSEAGRKRRADRIAKKNEYVKKRRESVMEDVGTGGQQKPKGQQKSKGQQELAEIQQKEAEMKAGAKEVSSTKNELGSWISENPWSAAGIGGAVVGGGLGLYAINVNKRPKNQ